MFETFILLVVLGLPSAPGSGGRQDPSPGELELRVCAKAAQRIQDVARVLRNGATAGAARETLDRERLFISADVQQLEAAEAAWLAALGEETRTRLGRPLASMSKDRRALQELLSTLTEVLRAPDLDRRSVQETARAIASHAASWEATVRHVTAASGR